MSPEVSIEQVEQDLEKAVKNFDWPGEFLKSRKKDFIRKYRALSAQLKEGDSLEIEVGSRNGTGMLPPMFNIFLYTAGGRKLIYFMTSDGEKVPFDNILYGD